jgi:hypothetical protein
MKRRHFVLKAQKLQFLPALLLLLSLFASAAHAQVTPLGDSYINTANPTKNFGTAVLLDVDGASQATYIQFNLASIPATASVSQATLKLYVNAVTVAGSFNVDYVNGAWSEGTIDANNAPPLGAAIASNVSVTAADKNQYILVNVTSAVQAWLNGSETNNGLALVANSTFNATFDSKESTTTSHPAELDIAFAGGDGTITGVTTASGSGLTGGGTSGTLNLSLTNGCAANQLLQWNGSAWACSSAGTGTITGVTAGTALTGGGSSGNVTLNLNTSQVPLLAASNAFAAINTFPTVGVGTSSPLANLDVIGGGGLHILVGNPGCGTFAAIGFLATPLSGCGNYALLGDASGGTYLNASGSSSTIHFRINNGDVNGDAMDILSTGQVIVPGSFLPGIGIGTTLPQAALEVETGDSVAGWFEDAYADNPTVYVYNGAPSSDEAYALQAGGGVGYCTINILGDLKCTGSKSAVVPVDGGSRKVALYAVEAPENWFEDYGSGQLSSGSVRIDLEPTFAQTVNTDLDYHVFLTPNGDCKGLYVTQKSPTSFEVHELGSGTSSVAFDYRIIAKRKNYENVRLADYTEQFKKPEQQRAAMRKRRQAAAPEASNSPAALEQKPAISSVQKTPTPLTQSAQLAHGITK